MILTSDSDMDGNRDKKRAGNMTIFDFLLQSQAKYPKIDLR